MFRGVKLELPLSDQLRHFIKCRVLLLQFYVVQVLVTYFQIYTTSIVLFKSNSYFLGGLMNKKCLDRISYLYYVYISNESFFLGLLLMFVFVLNFWIYHFNYLILTYISTYYYIIIFFGYFLQRRVFFMTHLQFTLTQILENIIL